MGYELKYMDHSLFGTFALRIPQADVDQLEGCEEPRRELTILCIGNQRDPNWGIRITAYRYVDFRMAEFKDRQKSQMDRGSNGEALFHK
jgi:hypothetical protein